MLLAVIMREPGAATGYARMQGATISSVNLAETLSRAVDLLGDTNVVSRLLRERLVTVEPFTRDDAYAVAAMRPATRQRGLSVGDRACLALALRLGLPALTADRVWTQVNVGVTVELLR